MKRRWICGIAAILVLSALAGWLLSTHILKHDIPLPNRFTTDGDLFFDFNGESPFEWFSKDCSLSIITGSDLSPDGRLLASGTMEATTDGANSVEIQAKGLRYTGNQDDTYAEMRVRMDRFDGEQDLSLTVYPCTESGDILSEDLCLRAAVSCKELASGEYVTVRFTNAEQFSAWRSLAHIENITINVQGDRLDRTQSIRIDYLYIGSKRQNHVMMDFLQGTPAGELSHWSTDSDAELKMKHGCLYGAIGWDGGKIAIENQLLYTVQRGDIIKLRMKLNNNDLVGMSSQEIQIGMGVGGDGYQAESHGTILTIPAEQSIIDGLFHEYTLKIPENATIIGNPLRSLCIHFAGHSDFEIDYIYIGSEINFSAYTGRISEESASDSSESNPQDVENTFISLRSFRYGLGVNDNTPYGIPHGTTMENYLPFGERTEHSRTLPYLSTDGAPLLELADGELSLGCLFGCEEGIGLHSYTTNNSPLSFDGNTYHFAYANEAEQWCGFSIELTFVQSQADTFMELRCTDEAWVYIDGTLLLNLSGDATGKVLFQTGEILTAIGNEAQSGTLLHRYQAAGREAVTDWDGGTFAEGSIHRLKLFYLKRSNTKSNFELSFNLSPIDSSECYNFVGNLYSLRNNKVVVRSESYKENDLEQSIAENRFYKTEDSNLRLYYDIVIDGQHYRMGDEARFRHDASIYAVLELFDPDGEALGTVEVLNRADNSVYSETISESYAFLEIPLPSNETDYRIRLSRNGTEYAISAPIRLSECVNHSPVLDPAVVATCSTDGKTQGFHCAECYAKLLPQETIPAIGHDFRYHNNGAEHTRTCLLCTISTLQEHIYENGLCICGAEEAPSPILDASIRILHSLSLESSIAIRYVVSAAVLESYESFYLQCVLPEFDGNVQIGTSSVEIQPILKGEYYYFPLNGLSAVRMNDTVEATLYMTQNGLTYCSKVDRFRIADYAYTILNSATMDDGLKSLCANLLRYGAEAQRYKAYRTNAPVDAKMTDTHRAYLLDTAQMQFAETDRTLGDLPNPTVFWVGEALTLDSVAGIKLVFDAKSYAPEELQVKIVYRDRTGAEQAVILANPTPYNAQHLCVTCYELSAAELRTVISVTVYRGNQQVSETLQYSAESYASKTIGTGAEALCKALFAYSDSALAYFSN